MQIVCGHCKQVINFEASAPKYCGECGGSLSDSSSFILDDVTIARSNRSPSSPVRANDLTRHSAMSGTRPEAPFPTSTMLPLETVGPYRLGRKLGQGGMGTVFEAVHEETGRRVALKLLSPEVRGTDEMVQRFRRESQIAASINHPRSTFVYEAGQHEGQLYITMELMGGGTLKDVVAEEGPIPVGRAVDYVLDMIEGLMVAHNAGIVHRDLKPSNSFVDADGRIKVGDFGLARSFLGDSSLTQTGTFMGTPQFAAPEQIRNSDIDERTDIYALGGTLFYLLSGRAPFVGNPAQVISSIASDVPPRVSDSARNVPKPLVRLIAQTLEKDPERRPFNLNMLRDGLLPFSTRGAMAADPGRRMAAFFFDTILAGFGAGMLSAILNPLLLFLLGVASVSANPQLIGMLIVTPLVVMYFAICETFWGRTLGKWMFGMRVVDQQSESPSFPAALIRAILIPGTMLVISQTASIIFIDPTNIRDMTDLMPFIFKTQAIGLVYWLPMLLMISTARRENGYRCVHEMLSGTRVVRLAADLESTLLDRFAVTVPASMVGQNSFEDFEVVGSFGEHDDGRAAFLAKDRELDRQIWLFDGFPEDPISEARRHLTRPCRLRIIRQSKNSGDRFWYATESVPGLPLTAVVPDSRCLWQSVCPLIRDVSYELALSCENDLIPAGLSPNHLWLDHTGRIRILDHTLTLVVGMHAVKSATDPLSDDGRNESPRGAAIDTIQTVLGQFMRCHDHPVDVIEFSREVENRRNDDDVFHWMVNRLNDSIERPTTWNWVDRIGMLAISTSLEFGLLMTVVFVASFFVMLASQSTMLQTVASSLAGIFLVASYGYFFNGGPAMHLSGIALRRHRDKAPASRFRSMIRSLVAWSPWVVLISSLIFLMFYQLNNDPEVTNITRKSSDISLPVLLISLFPAMLVMAGILVAVLNPSRGLPDYLVGTRMMRK